MQEQKNILKSAGIVSAATALSRVLGLARDVITANFFGTSFVYDAFVVAFMIPNFLRSFLGEGVLNAAFIPVISSYLANDKSKEAFYVANIVVSVVGSFLALLALGLIVGAEIMLGWVDVSEKLALTLRLLQWMSPYMIFICVAALMMGILNAHKHFLVPALAPVILNVCWIIALFVCCPLFGDSLEQRIFGLALGVLCAGLLQLAVHIPMARSLGFRITRLSWNVQYPAVNRICRLMIPVMIAFTVNQINVIVDIILAHMLGEGMQSALWYSQRIIYFPLGVFGVAMSVAIMPTLSLFVAQQKRDLMKDSLVYGLKVVVMMVLPCAVAILVLHREMISLFYERGSFGTLSVQHTSLALVCYGVGLVAFAGNKLLVPAYYALQDTRTPVRIGCYCVGLNLVLNLVLMGPLKQGGLALATSLTAFVNMALLFMGLKANLGAWTGTRLGLCVIKTMCVGLAYAGVSYGVVLWVGHWPLEGVVHKIALVFIPLMAGFGVAGALYYVWDMKELFLLFQRSSKTGKEVS